MRPPAPDDPGFTYRASKRGEVSVQRQGRRMDTVPGLRLEPPDTLSNLAQDIEQIDMTCTRPRRFPSPVPPL
jgi:hypothetical protein